jgi:hypothetical protein
MEENEGDKGECTNKVQKEPEFVLNTNWYSGRFSYVIKDNG